MSAFGLDKHYFLDLQFLNERNSIPYALIYLVTFVYFGGWWSFTISSVTGLVITLILQRFLFNPRQPFPSQGFVVITGCSSGIGRAVAIEYASSGLTVFATVRKEDDGKVLQAGLPTGSKGKLIPIICDINKPEQVTQATTTVRAFATQNKSLPFLSLVNNAGYSLSSFIELATQEDLTNQFNTNVFNLIAFTNNMLPLLREFGVNRHPKLKPKIINVSSTMHELTLPSQGLYASTKASLDAVTDVMRQEVSGMGIQVVSVCPGAIRTQFTATLAHHRRLIEIEDDIASRPSYSTKTFSKEDFAKARKMGNNIAIDDEHAKLRYYADAQSHLMEQESKVTQMASEVDIVVDVMTEIMSSPRPLTRYYAGRDSHVILWLFRWLWPTVLSSIPVFKQFSTYTSPSATTPETAPVSTAQAPPSQPDSAPAPAIHSPEKLSQPPPTGAIKPASRSNP